MATLDRAIEIASRAHAGVLDRQGRPYILHPLRVMSGVDDETARIVAVLHDVVEDTSVTRDDLREAGFDDAVLAPLDRVTHRPEVVYADYVIGCRDDPIALQVKLADLRDNLRLDRTVLRKDRFPGDAARVLRYVLSYQFLTGQLGEGDYREMMTGCQEAPATDGGGPSHR